MAVHLHYYTRIWTFISVYVSFADWRQALWCRECGHVVPNIRLHKGA